MGKQIRKYSWYLVICFALAGFGAATAGAMTAISTPGTRHAVTHRAKKAADAPVEFIAWKGNRLSTTAGTFIIDPSVQVIDPSDSRKLKANFRGPAPIVKLFFKDRKLVKVIIR